MLVSSDVYYSFFKNESRIAEFRALKIEQLTRVQQESLIRKRLALSGEDRPVTDGFVDQVEKQVNSVIISNRILPRYPFYVLSILQTYEAYMPTNMAVTSYGHCYHVLIVAYLKQSGISTADSAVTACFNLAEQLAFELYGYRQSRQEGPFSFDQFLARYNRQFLIEPPMVNRLRDPSYGIIRPDGTFRSEYMYYYFLAKYLAGHPVEGKPIISAMCENIQQEGNYLTLLFVIHHATDKSIIDDILVRTMVTLEEVQAASLNREETKKFASLLHALPENVLSGNDVSQSRRQVRAAQDEIDRIREDDNGEEVDLEQDIPINAIYRVLKNNKIMGQVLRNQYGNLERDRIEEIIDVIAESGLRVVNCILSDEAEMTTWAGRMKEKYPEWDIAKIREALQWGSFLWTMINIEQIVEAVNAPEVREAVNAVTLRHKTPAYDLVAYFSQLDSAKELTGRERDQLRHLMRHHKDLFIQRVLSIRTQHYMNTHRSRAQIEQSICATLEISYMPRMLAEP